MVQERRTDVGYRRPPKETQFRKGQSGNPGGRPKRKLSDAELLLKELDALIPITENGKKRRIPQYAAIMKRMSQLALQGNVKAAALVSKVRKEVVEALPKPEINQRMRVTLVFEEEEERARQMQIERERELARQRDLEESNYACEDEGGGERDF